jgi:hypothetical protein
MTSRKWPEVSPFSQSLFRVRLPKKNWARLIQKIYEVAPLCPKCQGRMKIIAFIEDEEVIGCREIDDLSADV